MSKNEWNDDFENKQAAHKTSLCFLLGYSHRTKQMKIIQHPGVDIYFPANLDTGQYVVPNPQSEVATNSTVGDGTSSLPWSKERCGDPWIQNDPKGWLKRRKYLIFPYLSSKGVTRHHLCKPSKSDVWNSKLKRQVPKSSQDFFSTFSNWMSLRPHCLPT